MSHKNNLKKRIVEVTYSLTYVYHKATSEGCAEKLSFYQHSIVTASTFSLFIKKQVLLSCTIPNTVDLNRFSSKGAQV